MNRGFIYLLVATALVVLMVFMLAQRDGSVQDNGAETALFMPGLQKVINEVDRVNVVTPGNVILATLEKSGDQWHVEQMNDYAADWPKLKKVLAALATAQIVERKTDNPDYYSRLGVEDMASENADGVMLELSGGGTTRSVIIGHKAKGRPGQYARVQLEAASALIDQSIDVPTNLLGWIDKRIVDINASEVAQVEIIHPDQERVLVMRISADQKDFDLADKPDDRELRSIWAVNSLANSLSLLDLQSVQSAIGNDWSSAVKIRVLLFSGVEIFADLINRDDEFLMRLKAAKPQPDYQPIVNPDDEEIAEESEGAVEQQVAAINQRVNGWVYSISEEKYEALVKKQEDLLKPVSAE